MAIMWDSYVSPGALTAFVRAVPVDQAFVLNTIFPDRYDSILEVEFADVVVTTRAAKARAWDTSPLPGRRDSFVKRKATLPAVSQFMGRGERDRLELERMRSGGQSTTAIEEAIYDDAENNARSVNARVEQMRGDLLTDGKVTLTELGNVEADFQVPTNQIVTAATLWSNYASADILGNLRVWSAVYRANNSFNPAGMVISTDVLSYMLQNGPLRNLLAGSAGAPPILTVDQVNLLLAAYQLPGIRLVYDAQIIGDDNNPFRVLDPAKVHFLPPAEVEIGFTQWGLSATALELQAAGVPLGAPGPLVQTPTPAGMVAVVDKDVRPPYRETAYVDATVMPILSRPRSLMIATVA